MLEPIIPKLKKEVYSTLNSIDVKTNRDENFILKTMI